MYVFIYFTFCFIVFYDSLAQSTHFFFLPCSLSDCTLQDFVNGPLYDSNFDITGLSATYSAGKQVRVACNAGFAGFFKLLCVEGQWRSRGQKCEGKLISSLVFQMNE